MAGGILLWLSDCLSIGVSKQVSLCLAVRQSVRPFVCRLSVSVSRYLSACFCLGIVNFLISQSSVIFVEITVWSSECVWKQGKTITSLGAFNNLYPWGETVPGELIWHSAGLMIERLRVRIPARAAGKFSLPVGFLCWLLFGVRSTPVLPQWHVKDPGHSAKSAGGRLHLKTYRHTRLT